MISEEDDNECLPIPRRSLINRIANHFGSDNENSPVDRRQSRLTLNKSHSSDSGLDETTQTPIQLIALYEKTIEYAAKNKINAKNAFHFPLVERLPEILDIIAFDDKINSSQHYLEPNFVKAGSVIDTSAKIYGYRVDALHSETQKLNGSIHQRLEEGEEELSMTNSDEIQSPKQVTQRIKPKASSYLVTDLSTISLSYEFQFHPFQPANMCQWPGGVGYDSLYADMVSYTMYSSSDFPLINGFIDLNNRINKEYDDYERILDLAIKTNYDLIPVRDVIKDYEGLDHILGCQNLREFSFNEESTESYIETIDECSIIDSSLMSVDHDEQQISNDMNSNGLSELRDDPSHFYFQELQSAYTFPTTMISMDMTLLQSKISFVDHIPQLLRDKTEPSEYSYFDCTKLKLFAGPYLWKYTNLLTDPIKPNPITEPKISSKRSQTNSTRSFKLDFFNKKSTQTLDELMNINSWNRKSLKKYRRKIFLAKLRKYPKHDYQLRLSRKLRPLTDLSCLNSFPDYNLQYYPIDDNDDDQIDIDLPEQDNPFPEQLQYDFIRPIHYEKIEFDKNFAKIDAKKLQIQLNDEYNRECNDNHSPLKPVSLSTLCVKLIDQGLITYEKDQIVSAFYCMLNNCNRNHLYMKSNSQKDDLMIQKQPFVDSTQLIYAHSRI